MPWRENFSPGWNSIDSIIGSLHDGINDENLTSPDFGIPRTIPNYLTPQNKTLSQQDLRFIFGGRSTLFLFARSSS